MMRTSSTFGLVMIVVKQFAGKGRQPVFFVSKLECKTKNAQGKTFHIPHLQRLLVVMTRGPILDAGSSSSSYIAHQKPTLATSPRSTVHKQQPTIIMHPSTVQNEERKHLLKIPKWMTRNKKGGSKHARPPMRRATLDSKPVISSPSGFIHNDGLSNFQAESGRLYFIMFLTCRHWGFYTTGEFTPGMPFLSALSFVSPSSSTPIPVEEMYIFHRPCPECDTNAKVLDELPDSSVVERLKCQSRWEVYFPDVETTVPDSIRRLGKFDWEVDEDHKSENHTAASHKTVNRRPVYVLKIESAAEKN